MQYKMPKVNEKISEACSKDVVERFVEHCLYTGSSEAPPIVII
jgi:hypothetical protein